MNQSSKWMLGWGTRRLVVLLFMMACYTPAALATKNYYVSPDGDDSNPGTFSEPLKTAYAARNKIRTLSKPLTEWVFVHFRAGRYGGFGLGSDDGSESSTYGIRYQAYCAGGDYAPELVIFDGGVELDLDDAYVVTDTTWLNRMKGVANGKVYCIDSAPASVQDNLSGQHAVVTMDDKLMVSSRWPDLGFAAANSTPTVNGDEVTVPMAESIPSLVVSEFARTDDMYMAGYISNDWYKELKTVTDVTTSTITFSGGTTYTPSSTAQLQIINVLAELDEEGEFYYDEDSGKFFFWPFDDTIYADSYLSVANSDNVISVSDCMNVGVKNVVIQNGATCGIKFVRGESNHVGSCVIRNCRTWGACIGDAYSNDPSYTGTSIAITGCDIYDCGLRIYTGGVCLRGGEVDSSNITAAGNSLKNCHIWNQRNIDSGDRGIKIDGVGNYVQKNLVHNILGNCTWTGNDQTIEYNEMFGICLEKGDGGALYTANTFWTYGNNLQYNFIHHILTKPGMHTLAGLYFDQQDTGDVCTGNVFYKAGHRSILWNCDAAQKGNGNLFVECEYGFYNHDPFGSDKSFSEIETATEAVVGTDGWNSSPWNKYSLFDTVMDHSPSTNEPIECTVTNNVFVDMEATDYPQGYFKNSAGVASSYASQHGDTVTWSNNTNQNNTILADLDTLDFTYDGYTPSVAIDFDAIGLYENYYRAKVPNKTTYRRFIKTMLWNKTGYTDGTYSRSTANNYIYYNFKSPMWEVYDGEPMRYLGLVLWLDGADRSTTIDYDWTEGTAYHSFKYWMDKSGCGNHFYQLTGSYRPVTNSDQYGINGMSTPDFSGTNQHMVSDMTLSNTGTIFVVVRHDVNNYDIIFNTENNQQLQLRDSNNGTTGFKYNATYSSFSPRPAIGVVALYSVTFEPDLQKWYYNGTLKATTTVGGFTSHTDKLIIGASNTGGSSAWDGEIAEVILYDRALGDTARQDIEDYLSDKWQ